MTRKVLALSIALCGLLGLTAVWAQDNGNILSGQAPIYVGGSALAGGNMLLRNSAPKNTALWYSKGKEIGILAEGEKVKIQDIKKIPSLLGDQWWVQVKRLDPDASPDTGWVYYGGEDYLMSLKGKSFNDKKIDDDAGGPK